MIKGSTVGIKFTSDGSPIEYKGVSAISDLEHDDGFEELLKVHDLLMGADGMYILPTTSWHITLCRGLNDEARSKERWPAELDYKSDLDDIDTYIVDRTRNIYFPSELIFHPDKLNLTKEDLRLNLIPEKSTEKKLVGFNSEFLEALGLENPNNYIYHLTLGYVLDVEKSQLYFEEIKEELNAKIEKTHDLKCKESYLGFFNDMTSYHKERKNG